MGFWISGLKENPTEMFRKGQVKNKKARPTWQKLTNSFRKHPLTLCTALVTAVLAMATVSQQMLGRGISHYANPRI